MKSAFTLLRLAVGTPIVMLALFFIYVGCAIGGDDLNDAVLEAIKKAGKKLERTTTTNA